MREIGVGGGEEWKKRREGGERRGGGGDFLREGSELHRDTHQWLHENTEAQAIEGKGEVGVGEGKDHGGTSNRRKGEIGVREGKD